MARVALVTGVSRYLGGRYARLLAADPAVDRVIGVDVIPPRSDLGGAEFCRADIRNPGVARILDDNGVDTVVHMSVIATPVGAGGRSVMKEINVIGTMQLLAACQRTPGLRRLVVKSTTTVYGASPGDPAMFTEDFEPRGLPGSGFAKDSVEVEGYVRGFARRRPDVAVTTLRFANVMGPGVDTPLTRYFSLPVVPTVFGFDPRLQFTQEDDLLEALRVAAVPGSGPGPVASGSVASGSVASGGTYNIAGDGVLTASQAIRRTGRPAVPIPSVATGTFGRALRRARMADFTHEQIAFLTYGRGVDTTRARTELGFTPTYSSAAAFDTFVRGRDPGPVAADRLRAAERWLVDTIGGPGGADG